MATARARAWTPYAWIAGIVFVVALVAETGLSLAIPLNQDDTAAKIARELDKHRHLIVVVATISALYVAAFPVYLVGLHQRLFADAGPHPALGPLMLIGGSFFVALHAVSDVGIYLLLAGKLAAYSAQHDAGLAYLLYLLTFALDSVGDVFGSLFAFATGLAVLRSNALPRWLGRMALVIGILLLAQAPMLGGVVTPLGLLVDGLGFILLLVFVLVSSIVQLRAGDVPANGERANR
jgi:hypothetical protein